MHENISELLNSLSMYFVIYFVTEKNVNCLCQLPIVSCLLSVAYCQLPIVAYMFLTHSSELVYLHFTHRTWTLCHAYLLFSTYCFSSEERPASPSLWK